MTLLTRVLATRNVGTADRIVRAMLTPVVAVLYFTGHIDGKTAVVLGIAAGMLLITALTGSCSFYYMLGMSTCPVSGRKRAE